MLKKLISRYVRRKVKTADYYEFLFSTIWRRHKVKTADYYEFLFSTIWRRKVKTADYYEFLFSTEYGRMGIVEEASNFLASKLARASCCNASSTNMSVVSLRIRSRYIEKFPNAKMDLRPRVWRQLPTVHFLEKLTAFLGSCAAGTFLETTSAMAKSANDIIHLPNVSDLDNSALSSCDEEEVGSISKDFPERGSSKLSVITSMLINLIAANNKETKFCYKDIKKILLQ